MLNWFWEFMPLWLVRKVAKQRCTVVTFGRTRYYATARDDILIKVDE